MKKLLWILLAWIFGIALSAWSASAASLDCLNFRFDNWDSACIEISKSNSKKFKVSIAKNNLGKGSTLKCYIVLPNSSMVSLNNCEWTFSYAGTSNQEISISTIYVTRNNYFYTHRLEAKYNFNKWEILSNSDLVSSSKSSSSRYYDNDLKVSVSPSSPDTYEWVKLNITTDDDYTGRINFSKFQYRSSSSSSWSNISRTSSTYISDYSSAWSNGYYKMTSSDDGEATLKNLIKFKKSGYYRIYVEDTDGNESYVQINVDTSSSSSSRYDDLKVSVSPSSPDTYEWVKLNITTDDDYTGRINFSKFQYRSSSSSSWSNISRTSSTYISDYSSAWSNGYYKMTSSDDGEATLKNLIKFKKSGYYRIYVEDTDGNESYVQINVDTSSSSSSSYNDDIELSTNRKSPSTSQYVNLTIETDDDYVGRLSLSAKYRKSSSDSWSNISNTSSTYFTDYSDEWENGFYRMASDDNWEVTLGDLVKFRKAGYYRIYVEDYDGNENYIEFNVSTAGSSDDNSELKVTASPSSPDTYDWVNLTVKTDADYDARIKISKFQYRSSSSDSWSNISNITSSTYVSDYSDAWSNSYRRIVTDEDGKATLKNIVKFKKSGYYRIYVEDTDDNESYVQVNVDTSSSSSSSYNDDIELSTNRKFPSTSQYVNLTIETDYDYVGRLSLSAKYRKSSSDSWSNISNTSSTYFTDYSDEWENGYYKMKSSDDGEVTLKNLVKFRKNGYYRIYVKDTDGNENYIQFSVGGDDDEDDDESSVSGFSRSELSKVKSIYKEWDSLLWQLQRKYPSLKRDTYWLKMSNNFYDDMKDVINNKRYRDFSNYDDFRDAFDNWYKYTMRNI